jgi:hypothetical protein
MRKTNKESSKENSTTSGNINGTLGSMSFLSVVKFSAMDLKIIITTSHHWLDETTANDDSIDCPDLHRIDETIPFVQSV